MAKARSRRTPGPAAGATPTTTPTTGTTATDCTPPPGYALVPVSPPGVVWVDGFNVCVLPFPDNPVGQRLVTLPSGPTWENP